MFRHVGLLQIHNKAFRMKKLPLHTVRQFIFDDLMLSDTSLDPTQEEQVYDYLTEKVDLN